MLKVTLSGFTPSAKRDYIASLLRPCWSQTEIIAIQEITSLLGSLSTPCVHVQHFNTMSTCSPRHFLKEVSDPNPALTTWIFFPSFRTAHGITQALRKLTNMTLYGSNLLLAFAARAQEPASTLLLRISSYDGCP
jgi:hypothetical protein